MRPPPRTISLIGQAAKQREPLTNPTANPKFPDRRRDQDMALTTVLRDLNKLNTFVRVAQCQSFTKAAAELRTTPSVISKRMKELEDSLGFSLLNRSTHGIALTEAGEGLFQQCLETLAKIDGYVTERRNIEAGPFGTLRVQAPSDYARFVLAPLTTKFVQQRRGLRVHLSAVPEHYMSTQDGFDIIVSSQKPSLPGLVAHDLGPIEHVICGSPDYFRRSGRPRTPQDLRSHNCLTDLYSGPKSWPFKNASRPLLVEVKGSLSSNSNAILVRMAVDGCGIVRVPLHTVRRKIAEQRLEAIFRDSSLSPERMCAYYAKVKPLPAKTGTFIGFLDASLRGRNERPGARAMEKREER
jgi:DNA-binding transcriptional LysR family regulator